MTLNKILHFFYRSLDGKPKGKVSIELMEGSNPANLGTITTIAERITASEMEVAWKVPKTFKKSNNYAIKLVSDNGDEFYGQYFKGVTAGSSKKLAKPDIPNVVTASSSPNPPAVVKTAEIKMEIENSDEPKKQQPPPQPETKIISSKPLTNKEDSAKQVRKETSGAAATTAWIITAAALSAAGLYI